MRRIVIAGVLALAVLEPVIMYRSLMHERERRQQAFAQSQQPAPGDAGGAGR